MGTRNLAWALAAAGLLAACSSAPSAGSSGSTTGGDSSSGSGSDSGSSGTGGSSSGTTGLQAGGACSPEGATQCADYRHQGWCQGGQWVLRSCMGPNGCQGSTCDRHDATPGSPCDALDTEPACDFNYNQLHCDHAAGTWAETCYCGGYACDDHTGTCPSGCKSGSTTGATTTGSSTTGTSSTSTSGTTGTGSTSSGSTSGSSSGSTGGTTGAMDGGIGGSADLEPSVFTSKATFGWFGNLSDGGHDYSQVTILAFDQNIDCVTAQATGGDGGLHVLYMQIVEPNLNPLQTQVDYQVNYVHGPAHVYYVFPLADGGKDVVLGYPGTLQFSTIDLDAGFIGTSTFWGSPYLGSPNPSPDGGYYLTFSARYCQL